MQAKIYRLNVHKYTECDLDLLLPLRMQIKLHFVKNVCMVNTKYLLDVTRLTINRLLAHHHYNKNVNKYSLIYLPNKYENEVYKYYYKLA